MIVLEIPSVSSLSSCFGAGRAGVCIIDAAQGSWYLLRVQIPVLRLWKFLRHSLSDGRFPYILFIVIPEYLTSCISELTHLTLLSSTPASYFPFL